jgi:antitoxin component YwqK of YwqJK toxin-antitoxin module
MRSITIVLLLLMTFALNAKITRAWVGDTNQVRTSIHESDTTYLPKHFGTIPDTFIAYYDKNLKLKARWAYRGSEGVRDTSWYNDGKIKSYNDFGNNPECYNRMSWYRNRQLESQSTCTGDTGIAVYYYSNGQLKGKYISYRDTARGNSITGHYAVEYYENGQLKYDPIDMNGPRTPLMKNYYKSGKVKWESAYQIGEPVGPYREWYETGQLKLSGQHKIPPDDKGYFHAVRIGTWSYYNESGKLIKEEFYEDGKLVKTVEY